MTPWSIVLPIKAIGKGRPRFGQGRTFTPKATLSAEQEIRWYLRQASPPLLEGPVHLSLQVAWKRPKTVPKKRTHPVVKPDLDNVLKLFCDAANGILWKDDVQVCSAGVWKVYAAEDSLTIWVRSL